jgi:tetratricopeptide (TPR) repeat protein
VYQSLLKRTQQQYHEQIAQVLATQFPDMAETQPELLAQHYSAAGLGVQALPYWQRAGERAIQRSAHLEAIEHLNKGLEILMALPETTERVRQELGLRIALGASLLMSQGPAAPVVVETYARARALCQQVQDAVQLSRVLSVLAGIYINRAEHTISRALAEQLLDLAQHMQHPVALFMAHHALGSVLGWLGEFVLSRHHLDQALAFNTPQPRTSHSIIVARVANHCYAAGMLWVLGYPDQALQRSHEAVTLAQTLAHHYSLGFALHYKGWVHWWRREPLKSFQCAEEIVLATQYGFALWHAGGTIVRGCALAMQGHRAEGMLQIREGIIA